MTRLRTTLVAVGAGTALVATGAVVASSATATPPRSPPSAELGVDAEAPVGTAADTTVTPRPTAHPPAPPLAGGGRS